MYPRNAASPERIAIGPVVQISDGAVQTSGCTVRLLESGGTEGDGGGTTAYSTDGVVLYTPLQAETDQASFVLIAKKSGCIPACVTVITSASATAGKVVLSGETHTSAVIPTVTTLTNLPAITSNWLTAAGIAAGALDGKGNWNIGKTGYSLTATTGLGNQTADITGTVTTVTNLTNAPTAGDLTATMKTSVTTAATAATPTVLLTSGTGTGQVVIASGVIDANVEKINNTQITGNGGTGTEFGV